MKAGVNPDVSANCGATALHFASETGALEIVKELVEVGKANALKANNFGMIPLMAASEHCQEKVFEYLMAQCSETLSKTAKIDCLELLGASFANDKEHYNLGKTYDYLHKVSQFDIL